MALGLVFAALLVPNFWLRFKATDQSKEPNGACLIPIKHKTKSMAVLSDVTIFQIYSVTQTHEQSQDNKMLII